MNQRLSLNQVTVSTTDITRAFNFYKAMGLYPIVKSDHYARFIVPGNEATFSIHLAEKVASTTTVYFEVKDVDKTVSYLESNGFAFGTKPTDQPWEWREAYLEDPDKNLICIYHAGKVRIAPNWRLQGSNQVHFLSQQDFCHWMEMYKTLWESKDLDLLNSLFCSDAQYCETPFDEPLTGLDEIWRYWDDATGAQHNIRFSYEVIYVFNKTGWCKWKAKFTGLNSGEPVNLEGIMEVVFDPSGKCKIFREWWHKFTTN